MNELIDHEKLEIEVLELLKNNRFLDPLIFVGGTMLRLCHELPRYSVDIDFWFLKEDDYKKYYEKLKILLDNNYQLTDSEIKKNTILFELKSPLSKRRLKIEIRKFEKRYKSEKKIAFSPHSTKQVLLKGLTLDEALKNKIAAAMDRKEIRDFFDIEFLLRKGIKLPKDKETLEKILSLSEQFKDIHFKVKLGSLLDKELRDYYIANKFRFLKEKINELLSLP